MLISIVTISYNAEASIERTIKSVLAQTYKNTEYLIIDGGSKDKTMEIVGKYNDQISYATSEKDNGISDAFNKGIKACKGEFILFVNADDWLNPDSIQQAIVSLTPEVDILSGSMNLYFGDKLEYHKLSNLGELRKRMSLVHPCTFVRKSVYDEIGGFNMNYKCAMDYDFLLRAHVKGCRFAVNNQIITNMSDGGVSKVHCLKGQEEVYQIKNGYLGFKISHLIYLLKMKFILHAGTVIKGLGLWGLLKILKKIRSKFDRNVSYKG